MRYTESSKSIQNTVIYDGGCGLCQSLASWASEKTVKDLEFIDLYWESIYLFFDTLIPIQ